MSERNTKADSLQFFLTAGKQEAPAIDITDITAPAPPFVLPEIPSDLTPDESLGGQMSAVRASHTGYLVTGQASGLRIDRVGSAHTTGFGSIEAVDIDKVRYTAPGGSAGDAVTIANGETKLLEDGSDPSCFVIVTRTLADDLEGSLTIEFLNIYNNIIGMSNIDADDRNILEVTGTLNPDATGDYTEAGVFSDYPYYRRRDGAFFNWFLLYHNCYSISSELGLLGSEFWTGNLAVLGEYQPEGTAEGVATVSQGDLIKLRCLGLKNCNSSDTITNLKIWLNALGTQQVSDSGQLPAGGAGTITTTGSLADWPETGFCRIEESDGTLREIVYYSSRTAASLSVPAAGRALLGTSAAAGLATDKIYPVPGMAIAKEAGPPFTICDDENDTDAVSGLEFVTGITSSTGLDIGSLSPGSGYGLWLKLVVPAGQTASAILENSLNLSFTVDSVDYTGKLGGLYRVSDDSLERYELYRGVDSEPDLTASPWETFDSLPHESAALDAGHTYYFVLRKRNKYNLVSQNIESTSLIIDSEGNEVEPSPDGPYSVTIEAAAAGKGYVVAEYLYDITDDYAAMHWLIYFTDDGSDPDPETDEPTVVAMTKRNGKAILRWTSPAADDGDTLKVLVRCRRVDGESNYDSDNTDIHSTTAKTDGPEQVAGKAFLGRANEVT